MNEKFSMSHHVIKLYCVHAYVAIKFDCRKEMYVQRLQIHESNECRVSMYESEHIYVESDAYLERPRVHKSDACLNYLIYTKVLYMKLCV